MGRVLKFRNCLIIIYILLCTHDGDDGQTTAGSVVKFWEGITRKTARRGTGERISRVPCLLCWPVRENVYVVVDDFSSRGVYKAAAPQSAVEVFRAFKVAAVNESEKRVTEITRS